MAFVPQAFERVRALPPGLWQPSTLHRAQVAHSRLIDPSQTRATEVSR